jgi:hypothetical protein
LGYETTHRDARKFVRKLQDTWGYMRIRNTSSLKDQRSGGTLFAVELPLTLGAGPVVYEDAEEYMGKQDDKTRYNRIQQETWGYMRKHNTSLQKGQHSGGALFAVELPLALGIGPVGVQPRLWRGLWKCLEGLTAHQVCEAVVVIACNDTSSGFVDG